MSKTFTEYQAAAKETAVYPNVGNNYVYPTLGLSGEAGEVAEKIKKHLRDGGDEEKFKLEVKKELGDVLWYVAQLSTELGFTLEDVAQTNLHKLMARRLRDKIHGSGDNR